MGGLTVKNIKNTYHPYTRPYTVPGIAAITINIGIQKVQDSCQVQLKYQRLVYNVLQNEKSSTETHYMYTYI